MPIRFTQGLSLLLLATSAAARASTVESENAAAAAWSRLQSQNVTPGEARSQLAALLSALDQAGLKRSGTVALSLFSHSPQGPVRDAAGDLFAGRATRDPGLALGLAAQAGAPDQFPPELSLLVAREHLERALLLAPLEEGAAFTAANSLAARGSIAQATADPAAPPPAPPAPEALAELGRARALAEGTAKDAAARGGGSKDAAIEAEAHEVVGLSSLAQGDGSAAERAFAASAQVTVGKGDAVAEERRSRAFLQLARLAYARGDDAGAQALYARVGRSSPAWLDALFEASWAHFRRGEDERALGNLLTLHAPFFKGRYFPESFILKALVLYQNCRYADARHTLTEFEARYRPLHDGLAQLVARMPTAQASYELLAAGAPLVDREVAPAARPDVKHLEEEPDLAASSVAVRELTQELDSMDARSPAFRASLLGAQLLPALRTTRLELLERSGQKLRARVNSERAELRELLGQGLRLSYEIAGREKELAEGPPLTAVALPKREPQQLDDDEEVWPFQGEYWRDELGSYRFLLGERCRKASGSNTPQTAEPAPATLPRAAAAVARRPDAPQLQ